MPLIVIFSQAWFWSGFLVCVLVMIWPVWLIDSEVIDLIAASACQYYSTKLTSIIFLYTVKGQWVRGWCSLFCCFSNDQWFPDIDTNHFYTMIDKWTLQMLSLKFSDDPMLYPSQTSLMDDFVNLTYFWLKTLSKVTFQGNSRTNN